MSDIIERLQAASHDERLSCGALYREAAAEIERMRGQLHATLVRNSLAGEWIAEKDAEIERLRALLEQAARAKWPPPPEWYAAAERAIRPDPAQSD